MGKYSDIQSDVFSVFDSAAWKAENIPTWPADYRGNTGDEYVRVSVLTSGRGVNRVSASGMLIVDIFTPAGFGPKRQNFIADRLDAFLANKSVSTQSRGVTQFASSTLQPHGDDKKNPSLSRAGYSLPFNFFGVTN